MSWREFSNLLSALPADCAAARALSAAPESGPAAAEAFWQSADTLGKKSR